MLTASSAGGAGNISDTDSPPLPQKALPEVWLRHRGSLLVAFQLVTPHLRWPEALMIFPRWPEVLLEYLHYLTLTPNPHHPHSPLPEALMILPRWLEALDLPHHPHFLPETLSILTMTPPIPINPSSSCRRRF